MYKRIEKLAWLTGCLGVIGVILILFLQGTDKGSPINKSSNKPIATIIKIAAKPVVTIAKTSPPVEKTEVEQTQTEETDNAAILEKKKQLERMEEKKKELDERKKENEEKRKLIEKQNRELKEDAEPPRAEPPASNKPWAESELNQLVGKIQAENIRFNSNTNCVQIRITADNNNTTGVSQVERFLASKNYIIIGREKEDFLRGNGLRVVTQGKCLKVTVGQKL